MADDKEIVEKTIAEDLVVTKYKLAGEIVNRKCPPNSGPNQQKHVVGAGVECVCLGMFENDERPRGHSTQ